MTAPGRRRTRIGSLVRRLAAVAIVTAVLAGFWGVAVEPRLIDIERHQIALANLPVGWEGQRVAVIADLQIGMWLGNPGTAERVVRRLIDERPAIALVAGDLVYGESRSAQRSAKVVDILRLIPQAGIPIEGLNSSHAPRRRSRRGQNDLCSVMRVRRSLEDAGE